MVRLDRPPGYDFKLDPPDRLTCGESTVDVGATVYRALAFLAAHAGRASVTDLTQAVWGIPEVPRRTLHSLCHRASDALARVGCVQRCGVDGPDALLC